MSQRSQKEIMNDMTFSSGEVIKMNCGKEKKPIFVILMRGGVRN